MFSNYPVKIDSESNMALLQEFNKILVSSPTQSQITAMWDKEKERLEEAIKSADKKVKIILLYNVMHSAIPPLSAFMRLYLAWLDKEDEDIISIVLHQMEDDQATSKKHIANSIRIQALKDRLAELNIPIAPTTILTKFEKALDNKNSPNVLDLIWEEEPETLQNMIRSFDQAYKKRLLDKVMYSAHRISHFIHQYLNWLTPEDRVIVRLVLNDIEKAQSKKHTHTNLIRITALQECLDRLDKLSKTTDTPASSETMEKSQKRKGEESATERATKHPRLDDNLQKSRTSTTSTTTTTSQPVTASSRHRLATTPSINVDSKPNITPLNKFNAILLKKGTTQDEINAMWDNEKGLKEAIKRANQDSRKALLYNVMHSSRHLSIFMRVYLDWLDKEDINIICAVLKHMEDEQATSKKHIANSIRIQALKDRLAELNTPIIITKFKEVLINYKNENDLLLLYGVWNKNQTLRDTIRNLDESGKRGLLCDVIYSSSRLNSFIKWYLDWLTTEDRNIVHLVLNDIQKEPYSIANSLRITALQECLDRLSEAANTSASSETKDKIQKLQREDNAAASPKIVTIKSEFPDTSTTTAPIPPYSIATDNFYNMQIPTSGHNYYSAYTNPPYQTQYGSNYIAAGTVPYGVFYEVDDRQLDTESRTSTTCTTTTTSQPVTTSSPHMPATASTAGFFSTSQTNNAVDTTLDSEAISTPPTGYSDQPEDFEIWANREHPEPNENPNRGDDQDVDGELDFFLPSPPRF